MRYIINPFTKQLDASAQAVEFSDSTFRIYNELDKTKKIAFEAGQITTGTTRTLTVQDQDGTIALNQTWTAISASQSLVANNGVVCTGGAALVLTLPATAAVGDRFEVVLDGSTSWQVAQNAGQQIRFGKVQTTVGVGGSLTSEKVGDWIEIICSVANTKFIANAKQGNVNYA